MRATALPIIGVALVLSACADDQTSVVGPLDHVRPSHLTPSFKNTQRHLEAKGRRLFFEETFGGNGRTCGTCHLPRTFTITPEDIAALPPSDPLFAGALDVNMDFIGRAIFQYPLGGTSAFDPDFLVQRATPGVFNMGSTEPMLADGRAPNLAAVVVGATTLHLLDGAVDEELGERLPTADEIEAMIAFQESVLMPKNRGSRTHRGSPTLRRATTAGEELFNGKARCAFCHIGELLTDNSFHNTGVVNDHEGDSYIGDLPFDPGRCWLDPTANDCATSGTSFNTPQLRGARLTAPYFHNNSRATLRSVVEFYNSDAFTLSPANQRLGIGALNLTKEEVHLITTFLTHM